MKQVLFYTDTPGIGGAEKHMLLLAKHLSRLGHPPGTGTGVDVSLAYGRYSRLKNMYHDFKPYCQNIFELNVLHKHDPRHFSALKKILSENRFDLVHLHLWNPAACRYAFFAAKAIGIPIVTTEHDPFELTGIKGLIKKKCLAMTRRTITVSMDNYRLLDQVYNFPEKRLELVHNGIELDKFLDNHDKADLPVEKGATVITCIAELHHLKGHRYLLEGFKKLQAHIPLLSLILVGKGPAEAELRELAAPIPHVRFLGWRNDIPQILQASDLFILPSLREAFGLSVLEAMASGVAVVATNNGGTVDIIKDGVNGYLTPPASSDALAEKMLIALKNPAQKKDIQREALSTVKKHFTAEKMAVNTLAVYKKINSL